MCTWAAVTGCSDPAAVPSSPIEHASLVSTQDTPAWRRRAAIPTARTSAEMAVVNDANGQPIFYVFGGAAACGFYCQLATVEAYDPATNTWSTKAPMPDGGRWGMSGAAVINDKVYLPGGWNGNNNPNGPSGDLFEYTPATDSWRIIDGARQTSEGVAGVIGGQLYVLTGLETTGAVGFLDRYDPVTETWTSLPDAPTEHDGASGGVINGKLYVAGGFNHAVGTHTQLDVYDPVTNTWTTKAPMLTARGTATGVVMNDKLYILVGGAPVEIYDPATDTWSTGVGAPYDISRFAAASHMGPGGQWTALVTAGARGSLSHRTWVYDPSVP